MELGQNTSSAPRLLIRVLFCPLFLEQPDAQAPLPSWTCDTSLYSLKENICSLRWTCGPGPATFNLPSCGSFGGSCTLWASVSLTMQLPHRCLRHLMKSHMKTSSHSASVWHPVLNTSQTLGFRGNAISGGSKRLLFQNLTFFSYSVGNLSKEITLRTITEPAFNCHNTPRDITPNTRLL